MGFLKSETIHVESVLFVVKNNGVFVHIHTLDGV